MKQTINCNEIQVGDRVVGFKGRVTEVKNFVESFKGINRNGINRPRILVTFDSGEEWETSKHFETTVIR